MYIDWPVVQTELPLQRRPALLPRWPPPPPPVPPAAPPPHPPQVGWWAR